MCVRVMSVMCVFVRVLWFLPLDLEKHRCLVRQIPVQMISLLRRVATLPACLTAHPIASIGLTKVPENTPLQH